MKPSKDIILGVLDDLVSNFVYYDRRNSEDLPLGVLEKTVKTGEISVDEMAEHFKNKLESSLED